MRRMVVFNRLTAGGAFAGSDGNLDWTVPDEELDRSAAESTGKFDTMLFGRRTYDLFESFWPRALDDPQTAPDPHGDRRTPAMRALAVWINDAKKVVYSRTRSEVRWKNSELRRTFDPRAVEALKAGPGKDIIVFGSGTLVSQLTEHRLIDEYQLVVSPRFIGGGKLMLAEMKQDAPLRLLDVKKTAVGTLVLSYAPAT